LGLTTTPGSDWKDKIREIDKYNIREIALFPTFLKPKERKELYSKLEKSKLLKIPHVHLRNDDNFEWELDYFIDKYQTKAFNVHPEKKGFELSSNPHWNKIFIENMYGPYGNKKYFGENIFQKCGVAGICLDFAHLESERRMLPDDYKQKLELLDKYKIGCNHVGAIFEKKYADPLDGEMKYDSHCLSDLKQLDYLKNYPIKYFSPYVSTELENTFKEQMKVKKYIEDIIKAKENE